MKGRHVPGSGILSSLISFSYSTNLTQSSLFFSSETPQPYTWRRLPAKQRRQLPKRHLGKNVLGDVRQLGGNQEADQVAERGQLDVPGEHGGEEELRQLGGVGLGDHVQQQEQQQRQLGELGQPLGGRGQGEERGQEPGALCG